MSSSTIRSRADQAIGLALEKRGFRPLAPGRFAREIVQGVDGWVGVGLGSHKRGGQVDADPMVGVRHRAVEDIVGSGPGDATLFRPLYEVLPGAHYRTWSFDDSNVEGQATALAKAITEVGVRAMREFVSLDDLEAGLREVAFADVRRSRLPAVLLARGDPDAARHEISVERSQLQKLGDAAMVEEYEELASRILGRATSQT